MAAPLEGLHVLQHARVADAWTIAGLTSINTGDATSVLAQYRYMTSIDARLALAILQIGISSTHNAYASSMARLYFAKPNKGIGNRPIGVDTYRIAIAGPE